MTERKRRFTVTLRPTELMVLERLAALEDRSASATLGRLVMARGRELGMVRLDDCRKEQTGHGGARTCDQPKAG